MASPTKKVALAAWSEFAVTTHITNMTPVFIVFIVKQASKKSCLVQMDCRIEKTNLGLTGHTALKPEKCPTEMWSAGTHHTFLTTCIQCSNKGHFTCLVIG